MPLTRQSPEKAGQPLAAGASTNHAPLAWSTSTPFHCFVVASPRISQRSGSPVVAARMSTNQLGIKDGRTSMLKDLGPGGREQGRGVCGVRFRVGDNCENVICFPQT